MHLVFSFLKMYNDFFWYCLNLNFNGEGDKSLKKSVCYPKNIQLVTSLLGSVGIYLNKYLLIRIFI